MKTSPRAPTFRPPTATHEAVETLKPRARGWTGLGRPAPGARAEFVAYDDLVAFDEFVVVVEPELRRYVARKVRPEAVDDVLQEVWIAAWQALPTYDRRARLRTWIYGICVHKCHDHYRKARAESRLVPLDGLALPDARPSPESAAIRADTVERLLDGLDEVQREVLELYYYAQLTLAEIASALDRNLNTVKHQFYRAHAEMLARGEREELR